MAARASSGASPAVDRPVGEDLPAGIFPAAPNPVRATPGVIFGFYLETRRGDRW